MKKIIKAGATSQTIDLFIQDSGSTTGAGKTGLAYNTASLTAYYRKGATGSATVINLATQTVGGAYSSAGFVEIDATNMPGMYRLDLPNAVVDTAGSVSLLLKGASGMAPLPVELQVTLADLEGGVMPTITTYTGNTVQTGDSFARLGAPAGASTAADIAAVKAQTAAIETDTAEIGAAGAGLTAVASAANLATVAGYIDTEVGAIKTKTDQLTFTIANQVDSNALSGGGGGLDAAGVRSAIGLAAANLDTQLSTIDDFLDTEIADIRARIPAALVGGRMDVTLSAIDGDTTALAAFKAAVRTNVTGTVGAASSTTSVVTSSLSPAASVSDQFKGLIIKFDLNTSTAALRGQASDITASTAGGVLTVTALTTAPANGDTFAIL